MARSYGRDFHRDQGAEDRILETETEDSAVGVAGVSRNPTKEAFRLTRSRRHANSCRVTAIGPPNPTYG